MWGEGLSKTDQMDGLIDSLCLWNDLLGFEGMRRLQTEPKTSTWPPVTYLSGTREGFFWGNLHKLI